EKPRWQISVPPPISISRYLARRRTAVKVWSSIWIARSSGIGQRSRASRTIRRVTRWPCRCGAMPRRVVSTSGSSGISTLSFCGRPESVDQPVNDNHQGSQQGNGSRHEGTIPSEYHLVRTDLAVTGQDQRRRPERGEDHGDGEAADQPHCR